MIAFHDMQIRSVCSAHLPEIWNNEIIIIIVFVFFRQWHQHVPKMLLYIQPE